jgi:hypothetical protein
MRPEPRPHFDVSFMPRVLFQTVHRLDRSPSQRFRHEQYLEWFRRNGWDARFSWLLDPAQDRVYYAPGRWGAKAGVVAAGTWKRLKEMLRPEADVLFVQREAHMLGTSWFVERMTRKVPMVFDFDDAIWLADVSEGNRRFAFLKDGEKTARLIWAAAEVIAGNDYLADYARQFNERVTVIPTTIDTDYHRPMPERRAGKPVCIGWTGSLTTVPYFDAFAPVLMRLKERYGEAIRFKLIGEGAYRHDGLGLQGVPGAWPRRWRTSTTSTSASCPARQRVDARQVRVQGAAVHGLRDSGVAFAGRRQCPDHRGRGERVSGRRGGGVVRQALPFGGGCGAQGALGCGGKKDRGRALFRTQSAGTLPGGVGACLARWGGESCIGAWGKVLTFGPSRAVPHGTPRGR